MKDLSDVMFWVFSPHKATAHKGRHFFLSLSLFFFGCACICILFSFFFFFFFCTIQPLHNQRISVEETSLLRKQAFITNKEAQKVLKIRYFQVEMIWAALVLILCFEDREGHVTERSTQKQY